METSLNNNFLFTLLSPWHLYNIFTSMHYYVCCFFSEHLHKQNHDVTPIHTTSNFTRPWIKCLHVKYTQDVFLK